MVSELRSENTGEPGNPSVGKVLLKDLGDGVLKGIIRSAVG